MIPRYTRPEMAEIWSDQRRYWQWLRVETVVCEELAHKGLIPPKDWRILRGKLQRLLAQGGVKSERVDFHEKTTRHDVIAFTTAVAEKIGPTSRYVHFGLTSSDVIDTALALTLQESGQLLLQDIRALIKILKAKAQSYRALPTIGRSHGISAEPTAFGLKFLAWHQEWRRNERRLKEALLNLKTGKLSGAVGVNAHWGVATEKKILGRLGLRREKVATQVIPRDRHAEWFNVLALCGCSLERISVELRHLQRSEVNEVIEGFAKGQKGSSAMPHKRNPISSENLTGLARLLRSYAQAGMENIALWHERDISHSSVERVIFPDSAIVLDYALNRMRHLLENLWINEEQVLNNLKKAGTTIFSGHLLLALVQAGAKREEAYYWIQECALANTAQASSGDAFLMAAEKHSKILRYLNAKDIRRRASLDYQLRNVSQIYQDAFTQV